MYHSQEVEAASAVAAPQLAPKAGAKKGAEASDVGSLVLGPFSLQPATAALAVGAKQTISVNFIAEGAKLSLQQVGIDISDRCCWCCGCLTWILV